jgi:deoxyribose-phosphate aldolase
MDLAKYIDFTILKAEADAQQYKTLCSTAIENKFYSVCVPPNRIKECVLYLSDSSVKIATVIGFPLGYCIIDAKVLEIEAAISDGADELDAVVNISAIKSKDFDYVKKELENLRLASKNKVLKVIIENCYLTPEEIAKTSALVSESGADFVKTSTGFGSSGAKIEDIKIMKDSISPQTKIKAAGGIRTYEQAVKFIEAGASRIGASAILKK